MLGLIEEPSLVLCKTFQKSSQLQAISIFSALNYLILKREPSRKMIFVDLDPVNSTEHFEIYNFLATRMLWSKQHASNYGCCMRKYLASSQKVMAATVLNLQQPCYQGCCMTQVKTHFMSVLNLPSPWNQPLSSEQLVWGLSGWFSGLNR